MSAFGETNRREYFYINTCKYATLVLVELTKGKDDVLACYGDYIGDDRIRVLPYYPPLEVRATPDEDTLARVRENIRCRSAIFSIRRNSGVTKITPRSCVRSS